MEFAKVTNELISKRESFAVATVVKVEGSSLGKPGFKEVISKDGRILYGSLGGACPDSAIVELAKKAVAVAQPKLVKVYLESVEDAVGGVVGSRDENEIHVEANCGGYMEIYVEPYATERRLVIMGHGGKNDIEDALVKLGKITDFEVVVIDHSPVLSEEPDQLIRDPDFDLSKFALYDSDSVVVLTHGEKDVDILELLSKAKPGYVGMLGSRQRAADTLAELRRRRVDEAFVSSVHAPVGLDIGAMLPGEIAVSIMAEVIARRHGKEVPRKGLGKAG